MSDHWTTENFSELLRSDSPDFDLADGNLTLEQSVRQCARGSLRDWKTCELYPVVGYHAEYMNEPQLIGVAAVGVPRRAGVSSVVLYAMEDHLPDKLIDWIDEVMEVGDGLDCVCKIMLSYHRAVIPINGETLWDYDNLFQEVLIGTRSTNYLKLQQWNKIPSVRSTSNLLQTNTIVTSDFEYGKSFREEWA